MLAAQAAAVESHVHGSPIAAGRFKQGKDGLYLALIMVKVAPPLCESIHIPCRKVYGPRHACPREPLRHACRRPRFRLAVRPAASCAGVPDRRRHVGRSRFVGRRGAGGGERRGNHRRHPAALRSWRGDRAQGRLLRRRRHPRRAPNPMWKARRPFPASPATSTSSSPISSRPRASSEPTCWPPAITFPRVNSPMARAVFSAQATPTATRAISCSPPHPRHRRRTRPRGGRQARQPRHLLRA